MGLGKTVQVAAFLAQLLLWRNDDTNTASSSAASAAIAHGSPPAGLPAFVPHLLLLPAHAVGATGGGGGGAAAGSSHGSSAAAAAGAVPPLGGKGARDADRGGSTFDLKAALRAAHRAGMQLQLPPAVVAVLQAASAAGAGAIGLQHASVGGAGGAEAESMRGGGNDVGDEDEDGDEDGDGDDDSDAEYGDDGKRIKRAAGRLDAAAAAHRDAAASQPSPDVQDSYARGSRGPHLVVVPTSVLANWVRELAEWVPALRVVLYAGSQAERKAARRALPGAHVVVTSYSLLEKPDNAKFLAGFPWHVLVLDEAHGLKNAASQRFKHAMELPARCRVLLTGTPVQNNVGELVSLLRFLVTDMFVAHERGSYSTGEQFTESGGGAWPQAGTACCRRAVAVNTLTRVAERARFRRCCSFMHPHSQPLALLAAHTLTARLLSHLLAPHSPPAQPTTPSLAQAARTLKRRSRSCWCRP